jgi:hypothetical protein
MYAISDAAGTRIQWDCPEQRNHLALLRRCVTLEVIKDAVQSRSFVVTLNDYPKCDRLQAFCLEILLPSRQRQDTRRTYSQEPT